LLEKVTVALIRLNENGYLPSKKGDYRPGSNGSKPGLTYSSD
jgi:hypothetical protein